MTYIFNFLQYFKLTFYFSQTIYLFVFETYAIFLFYH